MVTMNGEDSTAALPAAAPSLENHSLDVNDDDDAMSGTSDDSSPQFDGTHDLMSATMDDEVTAQLAAAGPVGMAAAAAIASAKKRKRPHQFETNPSIRKRQQTRLLRKLRQTIDEFTIRVGMQAVVLVAIPGKPQNSFKCFGAKPLEDVIRNLRPVVMQDLETSLAQHAPAPAPEDPTLHELPPLVIDGIPTPVEKMTQAQLRAFIPLMLKYSTGRGKPGWGKESTRPPWWPPDLPWANVRMDARTEDEKQKVSWTHALRQIVINCYKFHGREDLLPVFNAESEVEGAVGLVQEDIKPNIVKLTKGSPQHPQASQHPQQSVAVHPYTPTVLQTISNPDGTVSIIQMDPSNSFIQLPDGTHAQVQGVLQHAGDSTSSSAIATDGGTGEIDLNTVAQATMGQEGQIILTGEDGHAYPVNVSGMLTVPMPQSMYQTVVANISSLQAQQGPDGSLQVVAAPLVLPKVEPGTESTSTESTSIPVSALTGDPSQTQVVHVNANGQVVHNDKLYQICEFVKPDHEKVIMMTEVAPSGPAVTTSTPPQAQLNNHHHQVSASSASTTDPLSTVATTSSVDVSASVTSRTSESHNPNDDEEMEEPQIITAADVEEDDNNNSET